MRAFCAACSDNPMAATISSTAFWSASSSWSCNSFSMLFIKLTGISVSNNLKGITGGTPICINILWATSWATPAVSSYRASGDSPSSKPSA